MYKSETDKLEDWVYKIQLKLDEQEERIDNLDKDLINQSVVNKRLRQEIEKLEMFVR